MDSTGDNDDGVYTFNCHMCNMDRMPLDLWKTHNNGKDHREKTRKAAKRFHPYRNSSAAVPQTSQYHSTETPNAIQVLDEPYLSAEDRFISARRKLRLRILNEKIAKAITKFWMDNGRNYITDDEVEEVRLVVGEYFLEYLAAYRREQPPAPKWPSRPK